MASQVQQSQTFGYHINFEAIISSGDKCIICNLSKKQNEILEVYNYHILKSLENLIIKQKDKKLYYKVGD